MKWYKHDPNAALAGMMGLSAEERGFYYTLIDLLYARDGQDVRDDLVCKAMACNPRSWRAVKKRLIEKGKVWETDGRLMTKRVEWELNESRMFSERQSNRIRKRWQKEKNQQVTDTIARNTSTTTPTVVKNKSPSDSSTISDQGLFPDSPRNARASDKYSYPKEFEDFYARYPLHVGKAAAHKAWERVLQSGKATKDELLTGADHYRDDPNRDDSYTKHPATWLNAGCHSDGPLPARGNGQGRPMTYKDKRQEDLEDAKRALKDSIARADAERESDEDGRPADGILSFPHRSRP